MRTDIDGVDMREQRASSDPTGATWGNGVGTNFGISLGSTGTAIQQHGITTSGSPNG